MKEGDILVVLDQRQVTAQLQSAQATLAEAKRAEASARSARDSARAQAELARSTYQRYLRLIKDESA
ncbi:MAG: hypothetical protein H8E17_15185, partial [Deltaproteobacteria bacterium]|nr:hypothetical protein [Deltaproteobacteria bacterium]